MSGGLAVVLPFGDGEYPFRITIGGWRRIQEKCDAGPEEIAARLSPTVETLRRNMPIAESALLGMIGRWRIDDVKETIYQALVGGGTSPQIIAKLMIELVDERPIRDNVPLAYAVAMAALQGTKDDLPKKQEGEGTPKTSHPEDASASQMSTAEPAARVSRPRRRTK